MIPAAVYARFSSDLQQDRSIEDQFELCRSYAARNGFEIVAEYNDRARSGASIIGRDGIMVLLEAARAGSFKAVIVEALDRISRDQEDLAGIHKRLAFAGIDLIAVHDGKADHVQVGIRGLVGALYLQDLAHKVRRGLAGVIRDGRSAGGRAYGYRPVQGKPGELEIVDAEAAVIRRVFEEYARGDSPRAIAGRLNAEGIPAPRGAFWRASSIIGNAKRAHGIVMNEVYVGRMIWNRVHMVRDPETGRRVSRPNPESEWQRAAAEHLRIVPDGLYDAAQERRHARGGTGAPRRHRPRYALSGLLRCGACGAGMQVKDRDHGRVRIHCAQHHEAKSCGNRRVYYMDAIEAAVIGAMREQIGSKAAIAHFVRCYNDETRRLNADAIAGHAKLESNLTNAQAKLDRMIDWGLDGTIAEAEAKARIRDARADLRTAAAALAASNEPPKIITVHPAAIDAYLKNLDRLGEIIRGDLLEGDSGLADALRALVDRVTVMPAPMGEAPIVRIDGTLQSLIDKAKFAESSGSGGASVAGEGFEPPTPGL